MNFVFTSFSMICDEKHAFFLLYSDLGLSETALFSAFKAVFSLLRVTSDFLLFVTRPLGVLVSFLSFESSMFFFLIL
jgi:hypothetical protein